MLRPSKLLALLLIVALLAGCLPAPTPLPTATPTATPAASATPQPTDTPTPAPTATATATATPAPTATPDPRTTAIRAEVGRGIDLANFGAGQTFTLNFDRAMDPASVKTPAQTYPYLAGKAAWNPERTALSFTPDGAWQSGQEYYLFLDRDLKDVYGKTSPELLQWKFHVQEGPRLLEVGRDPNGGIDFQPAFKLAFDRAMDRASVEQAVKVEPAVKLELVWDTLVSSGSRPDSLKLVVRQELSLGQLYHFSLAGTARSLDGAGMGRAEAWSYQVDPVRASVGVFTAGKLELTFNYSLDWAAAIPLLEIVPPVPGEWKLTAKPGLEFNPTGDFDLNSAYTIRAKGPLPVKDAPRPLELEPLQATPTSGIVGSRAESGGLPGYYSFQFAVPMDRAKTEAAFSTEPALPGEFDWYNDDHGLNFYPKPGWKIGLYTLTIGTGARDATGHKILNQPYRVTMNVPLSPLFQFVVNEKNSPPVFGAHGLRFQALDADGRRAIQLNNPDDLSLQFGLTPLSTGDFARRYRAFVNAKNGFSVSSLDDFHDLHPVRTWTAKTTAAGLGEVVLPADVPPGLYVLSMAGKDLTDYLFVAITRHTLVVKQGKQRIYAWATDFHTQPASGLEVHLYNENGSDLVAGTTGADGLWSSAVNLDVTVGLALAVAGQPEGISLSGDVAVAGLDGFFDTYSDELSSYLANDYFESLYRVRMPAVASAAVQVYAYTGRSLYQPGQAVDYKAVVREENDARYTTPKAGTAVKISLLDPQNNLLASETRLTNDFGTLNGVFPLTEKAALGDYTLRFEVGQTVRRASFLVQTYPKPQFELQVRANKTEALPGDAIELDVDLRSLTGQPAADRPVQIRLFLPGYYPCICVKFGPDYWYRAPDSLPGGTTDANGHLHTRVTITANYTNASEWGLDVSVSDDANQWINQAVRIRSLTVEKNLEVRSDRALYLPGATIQARVRVSDAQGRGLAGQSVQAALRFLADNQYVYPDLYPAQAGTTGEDGWATISIRPNPGGKALASGRYNLFASSPGADDASISIDYAAQGLSSAPTPGSVLSIRAENDRYAPYETARFTIESDFAGPALVTFERASVLRSVPVQLTPPLTVVEQILGEECAPNVFVSVSAWKPVDLTARSAAQIAKAEAENSGHPATTFAEAELISASTEIQVEAGAKKLTVKLTPGQAEYGPRQEASFAIEVQDADGKPVRAELSLALVDDALYTLKRASGETIFDFFYGRRNNEVRTYDQMTPYRAMRDRPLRGGGGGYFGETLATRSEFADTAAWLPAVVTGADGKATVKVTLPDDLTRWRLTARAVTADTRVGEATTSIITTQAVIVRPVLPNGLTSGDRSQLAAMISNTSANAVQIDVRLEAAPQNRMTLESPASLALELRPGETRLATWWVRATQSGTLNLTFSALDPRQKLGDSIRQALVVRPFSAATPAVTNVELGGSGGARAYTATLVKPPSVDPASRVRVTLSRGMAGSLLKGLEDLVRYPYGCVEQTMSAVLPNTLVARAFRQAGIPLSPNLETQIRVGLASLYGMQHSDGGWGWWQYDRSDAYMTAWVVFGLSLTKEAGAEVAQNAIDRGVKYLQNALKADPQPDPRTQAFGLYSLALAGKGDRDQTLALAQKSQQLDSFSSAALALALDRLGLRQPAEKLLDELSGAMIRANGLASLPGASQDGEYGRKTMASEVRTTALVMDALVKIRPDAPQIAELETYLMSQRGDFGWGTTNETAFTLLALSDHLEQHRGDTGPASYTLSLNGTALAEGRLDQDRQTVQVDIPAAKLLAGANLLYLTTGDQGAELYATITSQMYVAQEASAPEGNLKLERSYVPLNAKTLADLQTGDLVEVHLTYTFPFRGASYLMISDHLPGGLEALNAQFDTSGLDSQASGQPAQSYFELHRYDRIEIRGEQVLFFVTRLDPNSQTVTITYRARVIRPGDYRASPAEITLMYDPTRWGRSGSDRITVKETPVSAP